MSDRRAKKDSSHLRADRPATLATMTLSAAAILFQLFARPASSATGTAPVLSQRPFACSPHFSRELPQSMARIIEP